MDLEKWRKEKATKTLNNRQWSIVLTLLTDYKKEAENQQKTLEELVKNQDGTIDEEVNKCVKYWKEELRSVNAAIEVLTE